MMDKDDDAKMHAESDMRAMIEAEKIKRDPKRHAAAMKMAKEMMSMMHSMKGTGKDHG